jgi:hypothetical protein
MFSTLFNYHLQTPTPNIIGFVWPGGGELNIIASATNHRLPPPRTPTCIRLNSETLLHTYFVEKYQRHVKQVRRCTFRVKAKYNFINICLGQNLFQVFQIQRENDDFVWGSFFFCRMSLYDCTKSQDAASEEDFCSCWNWLYTPSPLSANTVIMSTSVSSLQLFLSLRGRKRLCLYLLAWYWERVTDEGTLKTPIPKCRHFVWGGKAIL